jgi:diguanylate cyclase (GGDEF)-like protein
MIKLNVDYYHEFNAHYGQETGDRRLREIAQMLSDQINHESQMVARLQGAEFALLLPGVSCENARQIALDIMQALAQKKIEHARSRAQNYLSMSIGLGSQVATEGSNARELLVRVDTALKLAKERGRNRLEVLEG